MKLTVRCVACKKVHTIDGADARDVPMCPYCFSPTVVVKAER